jgi:hypothetical protein
MIPKRIVEEQKQQMMIETKNINLGDFKEKIKEMSFIKSGI